MVNEEMDFTNMKTLGDKTYIFDHCGAYDIKNESGDSPVIELGSRFEPWSDAAKFLNWLGLLRLDGFHIVIVDNISTESPYSSPESCFNSAI
jgi:hypothetical protein